MRPDRRQVGVTSLLAPRFWCRARRAWRGRPRFSSSGGSIEGDDVHLARLGRNRLDDALELKLDQLEGVWQRDTFEDDADAGVIAMGIKVDVVNDPQIPQDRDDLTLDLPYAMWGQAFAVGEKVGMQPGVSAI
jgi:hypothetical protein